VAVVNSTAKINDLPLICLRTPPMAMLLTFDQPHGRKTRCHVEVNISANMQGRTSEFLLIHLKYMVHICAKSQLRSFKTF
jgi:hypothetical protein